MANQTAVKIHLLLANWDGVSPISTGDISPKALTIAAEIDTLTAERDAARAEVERLRPAAEAWEWRESWLSAAIHGNPTQAITRDAVFSLLKRWVTADRDGYTPLLGLELTAAVFSDALVVLGSQLKRAREAAKGGG